MDGIINPAVSLWYDLSNKLANLSITKALLSRWLGNWLEICNEIHDMFIYHLTIMLKAWNHVPLFTDIDTNLTSHRQTHPRFHCHVFRNTKIPRPLVPLSINMKSRVPVINILARDIQRNAIEQKQLIHKHMRYVCLCVHVCQSENAPCLILTKCDGSSSSWH